MRLKARGYSIQSTRIRAVVPVNPRAGRRFGGESRMDANGRRKAGKAKARTQKAERGVVSEHELQGLCAVAGSDGGGREGGRAESAAGTHRGRVAQSRSAEGRAPGEGGAGSRKTSAVVQGVGRKGGGVTGEMRLGGVKRFIRSLRAMRFAPAFGRAVWAFGPAFTARLKPCPLSKARYGPRERAAISVFWRARYPRIGIWRE
jgi:hypothetical protein